MLTHLELRDWVTKDHDLEKYWFSQLENYKKRLNKRLNVTSIFFELTRVIENNILRLATTKYHTFNILLSGEL